MAIHSLFATTVVLSVLPVFVRKSFVEILKDPNCQFINKDEMVKKFKYFSLELYQPTLQFLLDNYINVNLVISGHFLEMSAKYAPQNITIIKELVEKKLAKIAANCYYGESLTSIYNSSWWFDSIKKTLAKGKEILGIDLRIVYLEQVFRHLELENLVSNQIQTFLLRQDSKKHLSVSLKLSEFRRFNKEEVFWIKPENNKECKFYFTSEDNFFDLNGNLFQPDLGQAMRTCRMAIGYHAGEFVIKKQTSRNRESRQVRLTDRPNLSNFTAMEKATLRLWEHGSVLISSEYKYNNKITDELFWQFSLLQNRNFYYFLQKKLYLKGNVNNFSSPYEALVNLQGGIKSVEILLSGRSEMDTNNPKFWN
jgi:hypothetical protein